jgi:hypothetical protein
VTHLVARYRPHGQSTGFAAADAVVYYVAFGPLIKIGTTTNLPARLKDIPFDEVLATEPGYYGLEAQRHRQFAHLRYRGEWFEAGLDLLDHIATLRPGLNG